MNDFDQLGDTVSIEIDRRKLEKLIEDGVITPEELHNAPIRQLVCPNNPNHFLTRNGKYCAFCMVDSVEVEAEE